MDKQQIISIMSAIMYAGIVGGLNANPQVDDYDTETICENSVGRAFEIYDISTRIHTYPYILAKKNLAVPNSSALNQQPPNHLAYVKFHIYP